MILKQQKTKMEINKTKQQQQPKNKKKQKAEREKNKRYVSISLNNRITELNRASYIFRGDGLPMISLKNGLVS